MDESSEKFGGSGHKNENHETNSCFGGIGFQQHQFSSLNSILDYRCLMKCEGGKTYNSPGICPDCSMRLSLVNNFYNN